MPLYIRDDDVDVLADELRRLTGARTKTEAVRRALEHEIQREALPVSARLASAKAKARAIGQSIPDFDMKRFTDEMWGM